MLPSNKIKVGSGCEGDFFPPNGNSAVRRPRIAPPRCRLCFPNLQIWSPKQHHLVGVYFLPNLTLSFWASTTCSVQPPCQDAAETCPGAVLCFATKILPWCITYFLSTYNAPWIVIFPDVPLHPINSSTFLSRNQRKMPRGSLGPGEKEEEARHNASYPFQDRQAVLGAPLADLSSHQRVSESHNIFRCSLWEPCTGEPGLWRLFLLPPWACGAILLPKFLG